MAIVPTVGSTAYPEAHGYDGYIDNILIRLAVSEETPYQGITAEAEAPRIDTADAAEDIRDETGQRYSRSNLTGGAGLDFLHAPGRAADAGIRYWDSRGVDVFGAEKGDVYSATLMHLMEIEDTDASITKAVTVDGAVYYLSAANIKAEGGTTKDTLSGTGLDITAVGNTIYTLDATDGVQRYDLPSWTPANESATVFDRIWGVKARCLGVIDNVLYEAAASDLTLLTLPLADTVTDVVDTGTAVLVFTTAQSVYSLTVDEALALSIAGESTWIDETPIMAAESFGVMGIVTAEPSFSGGNITRFYTATLGSDYSIGNLQLIYQVGDRDTTDDLTAWDIIATRDSFYVAVPEEGATTSTVWRYYLPTGAYSRSYEFGTTTLRSVNSMVWANGVLYGAVNTEGLWKEQDTYVTDGYVIGPLADFFSSESKQWVSGELTGQAPLDTSIELYGSNDETIITDPSSGAWLLVTTIRTDVNESIVDIVGHRGRYHAAKVVMRANGVASLTPSFLSYSFRALASPNRDTLVRIPINVSDQIESPQRRALTVKGRGEAIEEALRVYEGQSVLVELYRPPLKIQGLIEQFEETIMTIPKRGSVGYVMYARIRGRKQSTTETTPPVTSGASLGQGILGLVTMGTGEVRTDD
jgi:hypothetical protein